MRYETSKLAGLEKHGALTKLVRVFSVPLLNSLPRSVIQKLMRRSSRDAATVLKHRGSALALEIMYTRYQRGLFDRGLLQGLADVFWHHFVSQPKALRNRLKIIESILGSEFESRLKDGQEVVLVSLGGGSARGVIQVLQKLSGENSIDKVRVLNIDKDGRALDSSRELAKEFKLNHIFEWKNDDARDLDSLVKSESADIIEMVGLLDYFSEETAVHLMKKIHGALKNGGVFIFANVHPNSEVGFVNKVGWPAMHYRNPRELAGLLRTAGFENSPEIIFEPLKVHMIASVKK